MSKFFKESIFYLSMILNNRIIWLYDFGYIFKIIES